MLRDVESGSYGQKPVTFANKKTTMPDITSLRNDTPGCAHRIHLNNAGAGLMPRPVLEVMQNYLDLESKTGGYEAAADQRKAIAGFYRSAATFLNTRPGNIAWAASATDAYAKALSAIPFHPGDIVLTTDDDYVSNHIAFLFLQKRFGIQVVRAAKLPQGGVDVQSMQELMDRRRPKLVAVTHVPTNSGLVQDVEAIGQICRERELWYLVDACQSAGQLPLDVKKMGCDFLAVTMRKWLRGPRGAGFLYVSDRVIQAGLEPFFPDLSGAEWTDAGHYEPAHNAHLFEYWEKPYALLLGSKAALDYALEIGPDFIENRVQELAGYTRQQLATLPDLRILDRGDRLCGIVTVAVEGWDALRFKIKLHRAGSNSSTQQRGNAIIDFDEKGVEWAWRVSPHYYNTEEEIDQVVEVVQGIMEK